MTTTVEQAEIYFILQPGAEKERGPYSLAKLSEMWLSKTIDAETLYATEGMEGWESVAALQDLFPRQAPKGVPPRGYYSDEVHQWKEEKKLPPKVPANRLGNCPDCGKEVSLRAAACPHCGAPIAAGSSQKPPYIPPSAPLSAPVSKKGMDAGLTIVMALGGALLFFFIVGMIAQANQTPEQRADDMKFDAYYTAGQFIKKRYPGAKEIGEYQDSTVRRVGDVYTVTTSVDGLNAFGGPVRKAFTVELRLDGTTWKLVRMDQW
jgi:hypothetical protein